MKSIVVAGAIILAGATAIYLLMFLAILPVMANAPVGMTSSMASGIYASLYRPVRDALPPGSVVWRAWNDYELYWCSGSDRCAL